MREKPAISVAIPAYNEEVNITNILNSLLDQKIKDFVLTNITVYSDGSNDHTPEKVTELMKKHKLIRLVHGQNRIGKVRRLNQIFRENEAKNSPVLRFTIFRTGLRVRLPFESSQKKNSKD